MSVKTPCRELQLTDRDELLLQALTLRIRLITTELAARFWDTSSQYSRRRLRRLQRAGLLQAASVLAHPLLPLENPVFTWNPEIRDPPFGSIRYQIQSRWTDAPTSTTVFLATKKAVHIFGGLGGVFSQPLQATHDIHVTALYVRHVLTGDSALSWQSEDALKQQNKRGKTPDAILLDRQHRPVRAVEFGGSYGLARLRAFHLACVHRNLPYELW